MRNINIERETKRLVELGMTEIVARELLAVGSGQSYGDVQMRDSRGRDVKPPVV